MATGSGTKADPWVLKTPPGTSDYTMYRDDAADPPAIVCQVGSTSSSTTRARSTTSTRCSRRTATGWTSARRTSRRTPSPARSRPGVATRRTRSAAGTACARATAGGSGCTCRRCMEALGPRRADPRRQEQPDAGEGLARSTGRRLAAPTPRRVAHAHRIDAPSRPLLRGPVAVARRAARSSSVVGACLRAALAVADLPRSPPRDPTSPDRRRRRRDAAAPHPTHRAARRRLRGDGESADRRRSAGRPSPGSGASGRRPAAGARAATSGPSRTPGSRTPSDPGSPGSFVVDGRTFHDGIDISSFCGARIVAAHDGVVLAAGRHHEGFMGWVGDLAAVPGEARCRERLGRPGDHRRHRRRQRLPEHLRPPRRARSSSAGDVRQGRRPDRLRGRERQRDRLPPPLRAVQPAARRGRSRSSRRSRRRRCCRRARSPGSIRCSSCRRWPSAGITWGWGAPLAALSRGRRQARR